MWLIIMGIKIDLIDCVGCWGFQEGEVSEQIGGCGGKNGAGWEHTYDDE